MRKRVIEILREAEAEKWAEEHENDIWESNDAILLMDVELDKNIDETAVWMSVFSRKTGKKIADVLCSEGKTYIVKLQKEVQNENFKRKTDWIESKYEQRRDEKSSFED